MRRQGSVTGSACRKAGVGWLVVAFLLCCAGLAGDKALGAEEAKKKRPIEFQADHMVGKDDVWTLTANVVFTEKEKEITLKADQALYWSQEDRAEITGNIIVTDPEHSATADVVRADFNKKVIYFEGHVQVLRTPKQEGSEKGEPSAEKPPGEATAVAGTPNENSPSAKPAEVKSETAGNEEKFSIKEAKKKQSTITCDKVEYDYDKKFLLATGNVKVVQEKRTATSQKAEYDEDKNLLTLSEAVRVEDQDGNWFECSKATIDTDKDTVDASDITGIYFYEEEEKGKPAETPAATPAEAPPEGSAPQQ